MNYGTKRMTKREIMSRFDMWWNKGGGQLGLLPIRVPKTASTSLTNVISEYSIVKLRTHTRLPMMSHVSVNDILIHCPERMANVYSFAFMREPLERFKSAYVYCRNKRLESGYREAYNFNSPSELLHKLQVEGDTTLDLVFDPQYKYMYDEKLNQLVDDVYPFDKINAAWFVISKRFPRMRRRLPRRNSTNYKNGESVILSAADMKLFNKYYATDIHMYEKVCIQHKELGL